MPDLLEHATLQSLAALLERRSCNSPTTIHTTDGTTNNSSSSSSSSSSSNRGLSSTEKALAAVWASVLRMDAASAAAVIKRDSDFFDLGGHSLLLVKVAAGVETDMGVQASHLYLILLYTILYEHCW
jgi:Phosphopantetheine attachment site